MRLSNGPEDFTLKNVLGPEQAHPLGASLSLVGLVVERFQGGGARVASLFLAMLWSPPRVAVRVLFMNSRRRGATAGKREGGLGDFPGWRSFASDVVVSGIPLITLTSLLQTQALQSLILNNPKESFASGDPSALAKGFWFSGPAA